MALPVWGNGSHYTGTYPDLTLVETYNPIYNNNVPQIEALLINDPGGTNSMFSLPPLESRSWRIPTVTYSIPDTNPGGPPGTDWADGWSPMPAANKALIEQIMRSFDDLAAISFVNVTGVPGATANIVVQHSTTAGVVTYTNWNDPVPVQLSSYYGTTMMNALTVAQVTAPPQVLNSSRAIEEFKDDYYHEIGHALGLLHGDRHVTDTLAPGGGTLWDTAGGHSMSFMNVALDNTQFQFPTPVYWAYYDANGVVQPATVLTPLFHDALAIQALYGPDMTTRAGNTRYGILSNAGSAYDLAVNPNPVYVIWDAGGVDVIDVWSLGTKVEIDLRPGAFSSISVSGGLTYNIAILPNVIIENANGGYGDDLVIGNQVANVLTGNGGNDRIKAGDDPNLPSGGNSLDGGIGVNTLDYSDYGAQVLFRPASSQVTLSFLFNAEGTVVERSVFDEARNFYEFIGGNGNDTFISGPGNHVFNGGPGRDTLSSQGSTSGAIFALSGPTPQVLGLSGTDTVQNVERFLGSDHDDYFLANPRLIPIAWGNASLGLFLDGGGGIDTLDYSTVPTPSGSWQFTFDLSSSEVAARFFSGLLSDFGRPPATFIDRILNFETFIGGGGQDRFISGVGNDTFDGAGGDDIAVYSGTRAQYRVDVVPNGDIVIRDLRPGAPDGTDTVRNIEVFSFASGDLMARGLGDDLYFVYSSSDVVVEQLDAGLDYVIAYATYTLPANVEAIYTMDGAGATGNGDSNLMFGAYAQHGLVLDGAGGHDIIYGTLFADTLIGGPGADAIYGLDGDDTMQGGTGDDTFFVDQAGDVVQENPGEGDDKVYAQVNYTLAPNVEVLWTYGATTSGTGNGDANALIGVSNPHGLTLDGAGGNDTIYGSHFIDTLIGGAGDDVLWGYGGDDTMRGGIGNDVYLVADAGDVVEENPGEGGDIIYASVNLTLPATVEHLFVHGAATSGTGNSGDNYIVNAFISTGVTLTGGGGNDTFVFVPGMANGVTITDFVGNGAGAGDQLQFAAYGSGATFNQINPAQWQVNYNAGTSHDIITFSNGAAPLIHSSDFLFT